VREKGGEKKANEFVYFLIHRNSMISFIVIYIFKKSKNKEQKKEENE
jgi:hypothetical protein